MALTPSLARVLQQHPQVLTVCWTPRVSVDTSWLITQSSHKHNALVFVSCIYSPVAYKVLDSSSYEMDAFSDVFPCWVIDNPCWIPAFPSDWRQVNDSASIYRGRDCKVTSIPGLYVTSISTVINCYTCLDSKPLLYTQVDTQACMWWIDR